MIDINNENIINSEKNNNKKDNIKEKEEINQITTDINSIKKKSKEITNLIEKIENLKNDKNLNKNEITDKKINAENDSEQIIQKGKEEEKEDKIYINNINQEKEKIESNGDINQEKIINNIKQEKYENKEIIEIEENPEITDNNNINNDVVNQASAEDLNINNKKESINIENGITNNINNKKEQNNINKESDEYKKKLEIKSENQIEINSLSKSIKLMESWSQTNSEEIPPIFPSNNKKALKTVSILNNTNNNNEIKNNNNEYINIFENSSPEKDEYKNIRVSKINKENNNNKKNLFNIDYDLLDNDIITEEELKKSNLNQITLHLVDILYKNVDKIKKKEDLKMFDDKLNKIANIIINMKSSNQIKVLECLRKTANSYIKKEIYERLEKKVDELNKIKKFGISEYSNISKSSISSKYEIKRYSGKMSENNNNNKFYK